VTDVDVRSAEIVELLEHGEMRTLGLMPRASNYTFLAELAADGRRTLAVYKPRDGEAPLWDFPDGTLCRREVAAYEVARELGWPSVPPTVLREGPHGPGSVQVFVQVDPREHFFTIRESRLADFRPVAAFDVLVNNADRKGGHCLLGEDGTIWVVDHGVCFSEEPKLRTVIWDFAGDALPQALCTDLERLSDALAAGELRRRLLKLVSAREVDACRRRADALVRRRRFPAPGSRRPYPWPPV
jgi:hypothetical protein